MKKKLVKAITLLHPQNLDSVRATIGDINPYLGLLDNDKFKSIFSLNYDLLLYWIIMQNAKQGRSGLEDDGFRGKGYPTWPGNKRSMTIYNLHGALFFFALTSESGYNYVLEKIRNANGSSILDLVENRIMKDSFPLYVCEGTSKEKLNHINRSDYLRYAFYKIKEIEGELVLYGVSLADNDEHIWEAIGENKNINKLYINFHIHQGTIKRKARKWFLSLHKKHQIEYFPSGIDNLNATVFSSSR